MLLVEDWLAEVTCMRHTPLRVEGGNKDYLLVELLNVGAVVWAIATVALCGSVGGGDLGGDTRGNGLVGGDLCLLLLGRLGVRSDAWVLGRNCSHCDDCEGLSRM